MVGSGPINTVGLGSGPRKQPGQGGNEILRSFLSTRRSWCWRGRGKQTVRMASTKSGFAVRVAGVGGLLAKPVISISFMPVCKSPTPRGLFSDALAML